MDELSVEARDLVKLAIEDALKRGEESMIYFVV